MYMCVYVYIYIYIYIEREREICRSPLSCCVFVYAVLF